MEPVIRLAGLCPRQPAGRAGSPVPSCAVGQYRPCARSAVTLEALCGQKSSCASVSRQHDLDGGELVVADAPGTISSCAARVSKRQPAAFHEREWQRPAFAHLEECPGVACLHDTVDFTQAARKCITSSRSISRNGRSLA